MLGRGGSEQLDGFSVMILPLEDQRSDPDQTKPAASVRATLCFHSDFQESRGLKVKDIILKHKDDLNSCPLNELLQFLLKKISLKVYWIESCFCSV